MSSHFVGQRLPGDRLAGVLVEGLARLLGDEERRAIALGLGLGAEGAASLAPDDRPASDPGSPVALAGATLHAEDRHVRQWPPSERERWEGHGRSLDQRV